MTRQLNRAELLYLASAAIEQSGRQLLDSKLFE
jgi:hypothetical protein